MPGLEMARDKAQVLEVSEVRRGRPVPQAECFANALPIGAWMVLDGFGDLSRGLGGRRGPGGAFATADGAMGFFQAVINRFVGLF